MLDYCEEASYYYGEVDRKGLPPTGMIHIIDPERDIYELFRHKTEQYSEGELCEMYITALHHQNDQFYTDGSDGITILYYPQEKWEPDDGGETQFYVDGEIRGIVPQPND